MPANPICCAISSCACCRGPSSRVRPSKTIAAAGSAGSSTSSKRPAHNGHSNGAAADRLSNLPDVTEMSDAELLADEKKALGFYMSSHPLARHAELLQALATHSVAELTGAPRKDGSHPGRHHRQRPGQERAEEPVRAHAAWPSSAFEDLSGTTPAMLWPEEFAKMGDLVRSDLIGWVKGTIDRRRDPAELVISRIIPLEQGPAELTRGVIVRLHKGLHQTGHLERLLASRADSTRQP